MVYKSKITALLDNGLVANQEMVDLLETCLDALEKERYLFINKLSSNKV